MNSLNENRHIERQQFFNGQRLFATDLQELESFNRQMRWLHNQSLHQPGIGNGFAVVGKKGDREVIIRPGYAIDAEGREIVLTQTRIEPVPPIAGDEGRPVLFDLTVSYPDDAALEEAETRQGICGSRGVVRLREEPVFCWIRLNDDGQADAAQSQAEIRNQNKIVLARAEVLNCQLNKDLSVAERLNARPPKQPYVCCGTVTPDWKRKDITAFDLSALLDDVDKDGQSRFLQIARIAALSPIVLPVACEAEINTSECNFLTTPCYSVRLEGERVNTFSLGEGQSQIKFSFLLDHKIHISDSKQDHFKITSLLIFQLLIPFSQKDVGTGPVLNAVDVGGASAFFNKAEFGKAMKAVAASQPILEQINRQVLALVKGWSVVWMGVEG